MIGYRHVCSLGVSLLAVYLADWAVDLPPGLSWIPDAQAIVGRPLTPVSFAGVARRTTRRAVMVAGTSAAVATESAAAASAAQPAAPAPAPAPAAAPAAGALPIGTVVAALPSGCTPTTAGGVQFYKCGADYYRTAFQGTNLVYVTAQP